MIDTATHLLYDPSECILLLLGKFKSKTIKKKRHEANPATNFQTNHALSLVIHIIQDKDMINS